MGKLLITTILFGISLIVLGSDKVVDQTISGLGVDYFLQTIDKLKKIQTIEKIDEIDYQLKPYQKHIVLWNLFDEERYRAELVYALNKSFTSDEQEQINFKLDKPFLRKIIKKLSISRDIFSYIEHLKETDTKIKNVNQEKLKLMEKLFTIHSYDIQHKQLNKILSKYANIDRNIKVKNKSNTSSVSISPILIKKRLDELKSFMLLYMAFDLREVKEFEIREYIRLLKSDKVFMRFVTFFVNYHFTYLKSFYDKV